MSSLPVTHPEKRLSDDCSSFCTRLYGRENADLRGRLSELTMPGRPEPRVSVLVSVYNHERFLRKCLDGIFSQQVSFSFEVIVADDASTDGSADIIREYAGRHPDSMLPIFGRKNIYRLGRRRLLEQLIPLARGRYVAFCEGDDYWTSPYKLQHMVDFMDSNPGYSLCFHAHRTESEVPGMNAELPTYRRPHRVGVQEVMIEQLAQLSSVMARTATLQGDEELQGDYDRRRFRDYDYRIFLSLLNAGKAFMFPQAWGVYRIHTGGVYTQRRISLAEPETDTQRLLTALQNCYGGKYPDLCRRRRDFLSFNSMLNRWTYSRREGHYLKAAGKLAGAFLRYPRLFLHTYYHRYIR